MSFARHQTFYIRAGWLAKALEALEVKPRLFSMEEATTELGIGKNMVQALRFWARAAALIEPKTDKSGNLKLSAFGKLVREYDPYLEHSLTWWLIHVHIVTNKDEATTWYYLYNQFNSQEFDSVLLIQSLENFLRGKTEISRSSLMKDYDCLRATYVAPRKESGTPEDNIICPLTKLGLLEELQSRYLRKVQPQQEIPLAVFYHVVFNKSNGMKDINIEQLTDSECSPAKVFNLTLDSVYRYLDLLKDRGWVDLSRTAGLDTVKLLKEKSWDLITDAYADLKEVGGK